MYSLFKDLNYSLFKETWNLFKCQKTLQLPEWTQEHPQGPVQPTQHLLQSSQGQLESI